MAGCLFPVIDWIDFIMLCVSVAVILSNIVRIGKDLKVSAIFPFILCFGD